MAYCSGMGEVGQGVPAGDGYRLVLDGNTIKAFNSAGRALKSVPAKVKKTEEYRRVEQLREFLDRHDAEAGARVQSWLLGSLPVPGAVLAQVWADEAWRSWLIDIVVAGPERRPLGLLRTVEPAPDGARVGVVDLEGESTHLDVASVVFPHPLQLGADLSDYQEFSAELGLTPRIDQLFRQLHQKPEAISGTEVDEFDGAQFAQLRFATGRARSLGFGVSGAYTTCRTVADGRPVEARIWIGEGDPESPTSLGELTWTENGTGLDLRDVPPVAYSEGMRMATLLYAGRTVDESEDR